MATWKETISPLLKKYKTQTDRVFSAYNKELKTKKISSTAEMNKLWREKYKSKLDAIEKRHNQEYKKVWERFYK